MGGVQINHGHASVPRHIQGGWVGMHAVLQEATETETHLKRSQKGCVQLGS